MKPAPPVTRSLMVFLLLGTRWRCAGPQGTARCRALAPQSQCRRDPGHHGVRARDAVCGHATDRSRRSRTWKRALADVPCTTGGRRRVIRCRSPSTAPMVLDCSLASTLSARRHRARDRLRSRRPPSPPRRRRTGSRAWCPARRRRSAAGGSAGRGRAARSVPRLGEVLPGPVEVGEPADQQRRPGAYGERGDDLLRAQLGQAVRRDGAGSVCSVNGAPLDPAYTPPAEEARKSPRRRVDRAPPARKSSRTAISSSRSASAAAHDAGAGAPVDLPPPAGSSPAAASSASTEPRGPPTGLVWY